MECETALGAALYAGLCGNFQEFSSGCFEEFFLLSKTVQDQVTRAVLMLCLTLQCAYHLARNNSLQSKNMLIKNQN